MHKESRWGGCGCFCPCCCNCGCKVQVPVQEKCCTVKKCCKQTTSYEQKSGCHDMGNANGFDI